MGYRLRTETNRGFDSGQGEQGTAPEAVRVGYTLPNVNRRLVLAVMSDQRLQGLRGWNGPKQGPSGLRAFRGLALDAPVGGRRVHPDPTGLLLVGGTVRSTL